MISADLIFVDMLARGDSIGSETQVITLTVQRLYDRLGRQHCPFALQHLALAFASLPLQDLSDFRLFNQQ
jgi:hypothetical protein